MATVNNDNDKDNKADVEVPANAQTAPNEVDKATGKSVVKGDESKAQAAQADDLHVVQHLDRDPNDPRNAEPTPVLPSLDHKSQQGPEHGRVSQEDDHSSVGQNGRKN